MCGIAGMLVRPGTTIRHDDVRRMQAALRHRGPDGDGQFQSAQVSLAHTRLSIIDLAGGAQPLYSGDNNLVLIANGEIYNYVELRERCANDGYVFRTQSDCEVILPLYERYGTDCVEHLRGMFAFALWDQRRERLVLARDRMGEKPLYLFKTHNTVIFASELRAIMASQQVPARLDAQAVSDYFYYQFVPEPRSIVANVKKLPPATVLTIDVKEWAIKERQYWHLLDAEPLDGDPAVVLRERLDDAITHVLRADVPIGLSLSGGIDSSAIACLAARAYPGKLTAISAGYREPSDVDERHYARELAQATGIDYVDVEISVAEAEDGFADMVVRRDEPIGDISGYAYERVMMAARAHNIPVMLQGQGVDELMWGYPWVKQSVIMNEPFSARSAFHLMRGDGRLMQRVRLMSRYLDGGRLDGKYLQFFDRTPHFGWMIGATGQFFGNELLAHSPLDARRHFRRPEVFERGDLTITRLISDLYLLGNGIPQCDRLSMAHGIESRLPFLDHRFVEAVIGLRKTRPDNHLAAKQRFVDSVGDIVPAAVFRRPKRGFTPPVLAWQDRLRNRYGAQLADGVLVNSGIIQRAAAARLAIEYTEDAPLAVASRVSTVFEIWLRSIFGSQTVELETCP